MYSGAFVNSPDVAAFEALSLPLFPGITEAQLTTVAAAIEDYVRG